MIYSLLVTDITLELLTIMHLCPHVSAMQKTSNYLLKLKNMKSEKSDVDLDLINNGVCLKFKIRAFDLLQYYLDSIYPKAYLTNKFKSYF